MTDDGAGAAALATLGAGWVLPAGVELLDLGTPGPYFAEYLRGYEAVVVLDALAGEGEPGEIRTYFDDALPTGPAGTRLTPHAIDLGAARATLEFEGAPIERWIAIGVVPQTVEAGTELTEPVRTAIPMMARLAADVLRELGHPVLDRPEEAEEDDRQWWRRLGIDERMTPPPHGEGQRRSPQKASRDARSADGRRKELRSCR
jgi:hydrogenase maturation protease